MEFSGSRSSTQPRYKFLMRRALPCWHRVCSELFVYLAAELISQDSTYQSQHHGCNRVIFRRRTVPEEDGCPHSGTGILGPAGLAGYGGVEEETCQGARSGHACSVDVAVNCIPTRAPKPPHCVSLIVIGDKFPALCNAGMPGVRVGDRERETRIRRMKKRGRLEADGGNVAGHRRIALDVYTQK
ncbi:hypothetical protein L226DRAFT_400454 [Lentinus tigrinus ALCF2SS1-7]|uniref:uncharacterized protein n=1 Tax=Lentinus tigrinus ALCF2SS1-7 TaxID=1328758 RepID=UPI0011660B71|nr:hypothetical protein L226DRAFT_400454 [Lentinus tigrinus ALCF2SS1-7]